ncbi:MAG: hypothetical protein OHK005_02630 [Candidatus Methylacidiphilales bacterium]
MKPTETFEHDLEQALSGNPTDQEQAELARVCACLRQMAEVSSRSPQHQQWAWTRLQAGMSRSSWLDHFSIRWFAVGAAAAACVGLALYLYQPVGNDGPNATIYAKGEKLHAVPFHSKPANADVIWVDGYEYLPASYPLR